MKIAKYQGHNNLLKERELEVENTVTTFLENGLDPNSFCIMPFVNIILEPNGSIGLCRHKGTKFSFGNLSKNSLKEIWESEKVQEWRKEFKEGRPTICETEIADRKCNLCPQLNKLLPYAEIANIKDPKIIRLTANLNGFCNLECKMCDVWQMPNGYYTDENFWIPAREIFFPYLKEIDLLSGEPFLQKDTFRLIDEVSSLNPTCYWTFTTNAHWRLSSSIKNSLDKINIKNIIVSIDSFQENTYSEIRKKGNLKIVLLNIAELLEYEKERINKNKTDLKIHINFLFQIDNRYELKDLFKFCKEHPSIVPFATFLYEPIKNSTLGLDEEERIRIINFYIENLTKDELMLSMRIIRPLIKSLSKFEYINALIRLKEKLNYA